MSKNAQLASLINYISVDGSGNVILSSGQIIATQNYVATAVSNLVASAPSTLDTLNELATALGNDANFATTVTNSIATKLPLSGGTLTGLLTAPSVTLQNYLTFTSIYGGYIMGYTGTAEVPLYYAASSHNWSTAGDNRMRLTTTGLGIGTISPYSPLTVKGGEISWGETVTYYPSPNGYITLAFRLEGADTTTGTWAIGKQSTIENGGVQYLQIAKNGLTGSSLHRADAVQTWHPNGNTYFGFNVGIGTTSFPSTDYKFVVRQGTDRNLAIAVQGSEMSIEAYNNAATSSVPLRFYSSKFSFLNGSVGIGTSTIGSYILALDYNATAAAVMSVRNSSASGYSGAHLLNNSGSVMGHWGYANGSTGAALSDVIYFGSTAAKSVVFTTSDLIRMTINASGHVLRHNQPAFLAYSEAGGFTVTGGGWYNISNALTVESYDIGSNYSGGRFTAPVAGRYFFYAGGWSNINSNGERYAWSAVVNSGSQTFIGGGNYCLIDSPLAGYSIVYNLNAGDYVDLLVFSAVGGSWGAGTHRVFWGGYLL